MAGVNLPGESGQMSFFDDYVMENIDTLIKEVLTHHVLPLWSSLTSSLIMSYHCGPH